MAVYGESVKDRGKQQATISLPAAWRDIFGVGTTIRNLRFVTDENSQLWAFPVVVVPETTYHSVPIVTGGVFPIAAWGQGTAITYTVPAGKTLYLTDVSAHVFTDGAGISAQFSVGATVFWSMGGMWGVTHSFRVGYKFTEGQVLTVILKNLSATANVGMYAVMGGYIV